MEEMEMREKLDVHLTSAAAFVEGGIQEACEDSCSICLEAFCESDPSTVTNCKHEFHLQCVLEWCQRSSQCPMCWQTINLKDPTSQELLDAVEHERDMRLNPPPRGGTIIHHPTLGDFELHHLPVGANDAELDDHIIQHIATAAAAIGRHHTARRSGHANTSSPNGRPQFLVFSSHQNSSTHGGGASGGRDQSIAYAASSPPPPTNAERECGDDHPPIHDGTPLTDGQDQAGSSELQSFSDSIKSKIASVSTRYKESISRSTKGWKERLFSRNAAMADLGSEVRREVNAGIATVSRMIGRVEPGSSPQSNNCSSSSPPPPPSLPEETDQGSSSSSAVLQ